MLRHRCRVYKHSHSSWPVSVKQVHLDEMYDFTVDDDAYWFEDGFSMKPAQPVGA